MSDKNTQWLKDSAYTGGESYEHFQSRQTTAVFRLIGLNRKQKTGIYATVEYGKEDWFHADFDPEIMPIDRQYALFDVFKNSDENLWSGKAHKVKVAFDKYSSSGTPLNPIVKEVFLDL